MSNNVQFIDTSKECIMMMKKMSKDALKQGGKVVTTILKEKVPVKRGYLQKSVRAWAKVDYKTGQPYLEVGYLNRSQMRKKYGIKYFVNASWFEFGVKSHSISTKQYKNNPSGVLTYKLTDGKIDYGYVVQHPGMSGKNFLRNTVFENINEINAAMEEKLGLLTDYQITQGMNINIGEDEEID